MSQKERLYNPLFVEDCSTAFDMPKLVVIADEDARKGVEVCDGGRSAGSTRAVYLGAYGKRTFHSRKQESSAKQIHLMSRLVPEANLPE